MSFSQSVRSSLKLFLITIKSPSAHRACSFLLCAAPVTGEDARTGAEDVRGSQCLWSHFADRTRRQGAENSTRRAVPRFAHRALKSHTGSWRDSCERPVIMETWTKRTCFDGIPKLYN